MSEGPRGRGVPDPGADSAWGPTAHGGRRRRGLRRIVLVLGSLVLVLVLGGVAIGLWATSRIDKVAVDGLSSAPGPMHVLVVGSDSREGLTDEDLLELGTGTVDGDRTDTIFVLSVSGGRSAVLALPRDLWVTRCDGSEGRINAALQISGPGCLVQTVSDTTGLAISHMVSVNFLGFRDLVNAVGGVELCLEKPIQDAYAAVDLPAGCQTLNGQQALGYVRVRKIDNDLERIKRQQQFLGALADRVLSAGTFVNPVRLVSVSSAASDSLTSDDRLGILDLLRLARGGRGLAGGQYVATTVPVQGATINGAAVLLPIESEAAALFASFRDGTIFDQIPSQTEPAPTG